MSPQPSLLLLHLTLILPFFLLSPTSSDQSHISFLISQTGLDFVKDLLVDKTLSSLTPLHLPQIERNIKIPVIGKVHVVLSNITINHVGVGSSYVKLGDTGIAIVGEGGNCELTVNWHYSYGTWLFPVYVSDSGRADVLVEGMEIGLTLGLDNQEGSLKLSLLESGCYVSDISIKLDGGVSWLYQGIVDAFGEQIESAVEKAITKKLTEGVPQLDSFLQNLPKEISVDDTASLNVTFVNDPFLSNNSLGFEINGLFVKATEDTALYCYMWQPSVVCSNPSKMLGISIEEAVFNSASSLYFNAKFMHWDVDKVPDQSLLNTAGWKYIVPKLYKQYPNADMNLNISLSAPPVIRISEKNMDATVYADLVVDVLEADDVIPVVCISLVIRGSGSARISSNNLAGSVRLDDFSMALKWSKIGNLRMFLIQPVVWTLLETVCLPYANVRLGKGFPLPIIHGFTLQNAEILFSDSRITICSDVSFNESLGPSRSFGYLVDS